MSSYVQSSLLSDIPNLLHGFGTVKAPLPPLSPQFPQLWKDRRPQWKQVHETNLSQVGYPQQECQEVDALWTESENLPIGVVTADCVPILLAKKDGTAVCWIHAGWRGTLAQITRKVWNQIQANGHDPRSWVAAIGPSAGPCCYEVSTELIDSFQNTFPDYKPKKERHLDLKEIQLKELRALGISEVDTVNLCTICHQIDDQYCFHSYRREKTSERQYNVAQLAPTRRTS